MGLYAKSCPLIGQTINFTKYFLRYDKKNWRRHMTNYRYLGVKNVLFPVPFLVKLLISGNNSHKGN